jgi:hypothetical protein
MEIITYRKKKTGWQSGSNGREPDYPEFNPQYGKTKTKI